MLKFWGERNNKYDMNEFNKENKKQKNEKS